MKTREEILAFMQSKDLCAVSSINAGGKPQSAIVGCAVTDDFQVIFQTSKDSRKANNIRANKNVSVIIGWDVPPQTVQYEGAARQLEGEEADRYNKFYWTKNPGARFRFDLKNGCTFIVEPKWVRFTQVGGDSWDVSLVEF